MDKLNFDNAFYLKLGKEGMWKNELENGNKARIGWSNIALEDIQNENWSKIKKNIEKDYVDRGKKTGSTQDYNALKIFCEATGNNIFITFFNSKLYW